MDLCKNASVSSGSDCGWVDDIQFSGSPATLGQAWTSKASAFRPANTEVVPQAATYQYDMDAAQSGKVQHSEQTAMSVTVAGPTPLSFYWKSRRVRLRLSPFYIDSVLQYSITGTVDWTREPIRWKRDPTS